jgi:hypothetical protein
MSASYAANDEQVIANALAQAMGKTGAPRIYTTGSPSPQIPISAIYCVQDCIFSSIRLYIYENGPIYPTIENQELFVDDSGEVSDVSIFTFPAGSLIRCHIYSFTLGSGTLIAYPA